MGTPIRNTAAIIESIRQLRDDCIRAESKNACALSILEEVTPQIQEYSEELYNELRKAIIVLK